MKQTLRNVGIYCGIFALSCGMLFWVIRQRAAGFDEQYVDSVTSNSVGYLVADPCMKQMAADTVYSSWVKVRVECRRKVFTVSTLDARAFADELVTPRAALELAGNINHYAVRFEGDELISLGDMSISETHYWHCDTGDPEVPVAWDVPFEFSVSTLNCVYELRDR